jgi:serine protease
MRLRAVPVVLLFVLAGVSADDGGPDGGGSEGDGGSAGRPYGPQEPSDESPDAVVAAGRYILGVADAHALSHRDRFHGARIVDRLPGSDHIVVQVDEPDAFRERVRDDPRLKYVNEDRADFRASLVPSEQYFLCCQWGVQDVGLPAAWDTTLGSADIVLAILDTGVRATHEDIGNLLAGHDFVEGDGTPQDCNGHGTHVTSTAAGLTGNGKGVAGVAQVSVLPVRVLDCDGIGFTSWVVQGIDYAVARGADIISMSLGSDGGTSTLRTAVERAWAAGVLVVAAAGNGYGGPVSYPARYDEVVAVTAYGESRVFSSFSNVGPEAEISAPGELIRAAYYRSDSDYVYMWGTSMATPIVAGVAALALSVDPSLSNAALRALLQQTADDLGDPGRDERFGFGAVNAAAAIATIGPGPSPGENAAPTAAFSVACTALRCVFDAAASADSDGNIVAYAWDFGDGASGTGVAPTHDYGAAGTFSVTLTVEDDDGATGDVTNAATPTDAPPGPSVHTHDVDLFAKGSKVKTRVQVRDDGEKRESGVLVDVEVCKEGGACKAFSGTTNRNGLVTFTWNAGHGTYTACVTGLAKSGHVWDAAGGQAVDVNCKTETV